MIALLPVYRPSHRLLALVTALRDAASDCRVVVVDDGSGPSATSVLDDAGRLGCDVRRHPTNRGKGAALRTGFRHVAEAYPGHDVVSADADGQHGVPDILRVAERVAVTAHLVLGVRRFTGRVPVRRRLGNTLTRLLFRAATGRVVQDTQTGLRGYPRALLGWLDTVPGERFEYEMNVLIEAARAGRAIEQVQVETTYLEGGGSHFGSVTDSARIYRSLLAARRRSP